MAKSKYAFKFKEMADLAARIEEAGGDLQKAADSALKATHGYITPRIKTGVAGHVQTGDTRDSLEKAARVTWDNPLVARVNIGFNLKEGYPSIFLMWGTPKMAPDALLRDAAYAPSIKREVAKIQREALQKVLQRLQKG